MVPPRPVASKRSVATHIWIRPTPARLTRGVIVRDCPTHSTLADGRGWTAQSMHALTRAPAGASRHRVPTRASMARKRYRSTSCILGTAATTTTAATGARRANHERATHEGLETGRGFSFTIGEAARSGQRRRRFTYRTTSQGWQASLLDTGCHGPLVEYGQAWRIVLVPKTPTSGSVLRTTPDPGRRVVVCD